MNKIVNGIIQEMTHEEIARQQAEQAAAERAYWQSISYDDAVDAEIRKRYSVSQELARQRQKDEKPDEYAEYFNYCEECKTYVKTKMTTSEVT